MLSDEEKKAIDILNYVKNKTPFIFWYEEKPYNKKETINIILNLIEKQHKEIEELKNITKSYDSFLGTEKIVIADKNFFVNGYFRENYVSKDKIKAKIKELEKEKNIPQEMDFKAFYRIEDLKNIEIDVLQSLLEKE